MEASEVQNRLDEIEELISRIKDAARFTERAGRVVALEEKMARDDFWNDPEAAQAVIAELKPNKALVDQIGNLESRWNDAQTLLTLARDEEDPEAVLEAFQEAKELRKECERLELQTLLAGEHDANNCYLAIHAGAGGTESCDWAAMLRRMYLRWAERHGYKVSILDELPGEEAGCKSVTLQISGPWAYGYLRSERGVHRLVRISPFDAKGRRHTSFVSVSVSPEVEEVESVEIDDADLRVDTFRASGAGGQHVNKSDSAIRITHVPSGIVVQCQNERSQHSNRARAMKVLQSKLLQREIENREAELAKIAGEKGDISFGSQIRSYVLAPYKLAKDHRTDEETGNVDAVLDGDLDRFTSAYLRSFARSSR